MNDTDQIIGCLNQSPLILKNLIDSIPKELLKVKRIFNKWCIHEHVCHLASAESMIIKRFEEFKKRSNPKFSPYLPGKTISEHNLIGLNMREELEKFSRLRESLIVLVQSFENSTWRKQAEHNEYVKYNAYILLRHTLMHDHFHMYRIEELWLTKDEYL